MPNLIEHLVFRAKLEPDSVAIKGPHRQLTFDQLLLLVRKIAGKLGQSGVRPGQVVVTSIADKYLEWVFTLALFHEATITCSNNGYSPIDAFDYDWMITDRKVDHFIAEKTIRFGNEWLRQIQNQPHNAEASDYDSVNRLVRLVLTSGTTGKRKAVAENLAQALQRGRNQALVLGSYRQLSLLGLGTGMGFSTAVSSLLTGQPMYCGRSNEEVISLIQKNSIESLNGSPQQLSSLLRVLKESDARLDNLRILTSTGGPLSSKLRSEIESRFTRNVLNLYGSTEAGFVSVKKQFSQGEDFGIGHPLPGVDVQIVGHDDLPLDSNQEGLIRIRTPYMAGGYFRNQEETTRFFRGGWFYPGDRGYIAEGGAIFLAGREGELINRGGVKIDPATIDQFLIGYPGIRDAAAFGLEDEFGIQNLALAIVVEGAFELEPLRRALRDKFGKARSPARVFKLRQIPRTRTGKVLRLQLGEKLAEVLRKRQESKPQLARRLESE